MSASGGPPGPSLLGEPDGIVTPPLLPNPAPVAVEGSAAPFESTSTPEVVVHNVLEGLGVFVPDPVTHDEDAVGFDADGTAPVAASLDANGTVVEAVMGIGPVVGAALGAAVSWPSSSVDWRASGGSVAAVSQGGMPVLSRCTGLPMMVMTIGRVVKSSQASLTDSVYSSHQAAWASSAWARRISSSIVQGMAADYKIG